MFRIGAYSDIGPRKKSNQDSCCAMVSRYVLHNHADTSFDTALLAVCDGVGGLDSGEVASASVVNWLVTWFENDYPRLLNSYHSDVDALLNAVEVAWDANLIALNEELRLLGDERGTRMGTTCTAILFVSNAFVIVHVGDTRVYRFRNGGMEILTNDQTWVAQEVARGNIRPEKARLHPKRNVILQSVGTQAGLEPDFVRGTYLPEDVFMVCCDGFRNELFDDELQNTFTMIAEADDQHVSDACERLAHLALARGEQDNITAVATVYTEGIGYGEPIVHTTPAFDAMKAGD